MLGLCGYSGFCPVVVYGLSLLWLLWLRGYAGSVVVAPEL